MFLFADGRLQLHLAAEESNVEMVQTLLEHGAKIDLQGMTNENIIF